MSDSTYNLVKEWYLEADRKLRSNYLCKAERVDEILAGAVKIIEKEV